MKKILLTLTAAIALPAVAQEIKQEITIEKEIVPELRAATRLNVEPTVVKPDVSQRSLTLSDRDYNVAIPSYLTALAAARTLDAVSVSPYKGYVKLGYFPAYNLALSAGYRAMNDSVNRLDIYGQFNGTSYSRNIPSFRDTGHDISDNTGRIALDYTRHFNKYQKLDLCVGAMFSSVSHKSEFADNNYSEKLSASTSEFSVNGKWSSGTETENYYAGAAIDYFSTTPKLKISPASAAGNEIPSMQQGWYSLLFGIGYHGFTIDATAAIESISSGTYIPASVDKDKTGTPFTLKATPAYTFRTQNAMAKIGVNIDWRTSMGKKFLISPEINAAVAPSSYFSAYLNLTGGIDPNLASSLYSYTRFSNTAAVYDASSIPVKGELGLVIGPFKGASLELQAAYAQAKNWLLPAAGYTFGAYDVKGWRAGFRMRYDYKDIIKASFSMMFAPGKEDKCWYEWRDRAKQVMDINVIVTPIKNLDINAGWELRQHRTTGLNRSAIFRAVILEPAETVSDLSNLHAGAAYRFTDSFSVFLSLNNILNKKDYIIFDIPCQGISGLAGISFLF